jgi:hypothetical protein
MPRSPPGQSQAQVPGQSVRNMMQIERQRRHPALMGTMIPEVPLDIEFGILPYQLPDIDICLDIVLPVENIERNLPVNDVALPRSRRRQFSCQWIILKDRQFLSEILDIQRFL